MPKQRRHGFAVAVFGHVERALFDGEDCHGADAQGCHYRRVEVADRDGVLRYLVKQMLVGRFDVEEPVFGSAAAQEGLVFTPLC